MERANRLSTLRAGDAAYVTGIDAACNMFRRLEDIGFTRGARVCCLFAAPGGEPKAYLVRGAVMALRYEDARFVRVRSAE